MATERKPRKPKLTDKNFKVSIDTEKFDAEITKDESGVSASIDTPRVDVNFERDEDSWELTVDIDDKEHYQCIGTGKHGKLPKGTLWNVTGEMLKIFLKRGFAKRK